MGPFEEQVETLVESTPLPDEKIVPQGWITVRSFVTRQIIGWVNETGTKPTMFIARPAHSNPKELLKLTFTSMDDASNYLRNNYPHG